MAEISILPLSTFSAILSLSPCRESNFTTPFPYSRSICPYRPPFLRFTVKAFSHSGSYFGDGDNAFFPWSDADNNAIQWVQEERVTLFTADGLIQIGGSMIPRRLTSDKKLGATKHSHKSQRFQESNYMDPNQGLCLGALFDIAATNGLDMRRKLCIFGFCRSIEMLSDVVEDTVLEHGGEVVAAEKASKGGLHERLTMTVAVPYLWGVPPVSETLHLAVQSGGGIVDKSSNDFSEETKFDADALWMMQH